MYHALTFTIFHFSQGMLKYTRVRDDKQDDPGIVNCLKGRSE